MTIDQQLSYLLKGMAEIIREEDLRERLIEAAKTTHIHDEWVKSKFKTGQYKSTDVYGSGSLHDPALKREYDDNMKEQLSRQK